MTDIQKQKEEEKQNDMETVITRETSKIDELKSLGDVGLSLKIGNKKGFNVLELRVTKQSLNQTLQEKDTSNK